MMQHGLAGIQTADGGSLCSHSVIEALEYCVGPWTGEWASSSIVTECRVPLYAKTGIIFPLTITEKQPAEDRTMERRGTPCVYISTECIRGCQGYFQFFWVC